MLLLWLHAWEKALSGGARVATALLVLFFMRVFLTSSVVLCSLWQGGTKHGRLISF